MRLGKTTVTVDPPDASTITVRLASEYVTVDQARDLVTQLGAAILEAEAHNRVHGLPLNQPRRFWWRR